MDNPSYVELCLRIASDPSLYIQTGKTDQNAWMYELYLANRCLISLNKSGYQVNIFPYFSMKTYVEVLIRSALLFVFLHENIYCEYSLEVPQ